MKEILLWGLLSFAVSFALYLILLPLLKKLKAGQYILSYVKEHANKGGTPTMGGLAFVTAIIVVTLGVYGLYQRTINLTLMIMASFAVVGFLDDFLKIYRKQNEGLKPYQKILFQIAIAVAAALYAYFNHITVLNLPFAGGKTWYIGWGMIPLSIFVFIATVNCVNLTDGLDGLAGGTSFVYGIAMAILSYCQGNDFGAICVIACGALAAFLVFNTNKASVFMGDTGSLALGGFIACVSVFSGNTLYIPLFGIMFVLSGISVILQVIYYKRTRRRLLLMAPLHHHFQKKGYAECRIAYVWALITALVSMASLLFV